MVEESADLSGADVEWGLAALGANLPYRARPGFAEAVLRRLAHVFGSARRAHSHEEVLKEHSTDRTTVVGVFERRDHAEQAIRALIREGVRVDQIGFAMRD